MGRTKPTVDPLEERVGTLRMRDQVDGDVGEGGGRVCVQPGVDADCNSVT